MGILSALQNLVQKNVSSETRQKVVSGVDTALTILTSPIAAIKDFKTAKKETSKKSATKLVAEGVENTLLAVAPFTAAGKTLAVKAGQAAFKTLPRAAATITATGAALTSKTVRQTAATVLTPSNYIATGEKIGSFIENAPEDIKNLTSSGVVLAATGLGIAGVGVAAYELLKSDDKQTDIPTLLPELDNKIQTLPTNTATPTLPQTVEVSPTSSTRKRRSKAKREPQNIIQKTNIIINNSNNSIKRQTKKYLNARIL